MKKKTTIRIRDLMRFLVFMVLGGLIILSCAQDSIFFNLSQEPEPIEPRIPGSPTNMAVVVYNDDPSSLLDPLDPLNTDTHKKLYVGTTMSKRIFIFSGSGWGSMGTPGGGSLGELASDGRSLYALVFPGGDPLKSSEIYKYTEDPDPAWTQIGRAAAGGSSIQTLYAVVDGDVFAGGQFRSSSTVSYAIYTIDAADELVEIKAPAPNSLLRGAAKLGASTYLATNGNGIFEFTAGAISADPMPGTEGKVTRGIIEVGAYIVAVSSDGSGTGSIIISEGSPITSFGSQPSGVTFTGAMGIWKMYNPDELDPTDPLYVQDPAPWKDTLLLLGIRGEGSSVTNGFREMVLANGVPTFGVKQPGDRYGTPTSTPSDSKFNATIGKHPVQAILQLPDGLQDYSTIDADPSWEPLIFAATSRDGLWSYRRGQWNAEE